MGTWFLIVYVHGQLTQAHRLWMRLPLEPVVRQPLQHPTSGLGFLFQFLKDVIGTLIIEAQL